CGGRFYNNRETMNDDLIVNGFMENYLSWSLMHNFDTQRDNDQNEEVTKNIESDDIVGTIDDTSDTTDNDGVGNMRDDEYDDD
ncbi:hypothetical protein Tco_0504453, partial [Tanacetum coccineum]